MTGPRVRAQRVGGVACHASLLSGVREGTQSHGHAAILAKVQGCVGWERAQLVGLVALVPGGGGRGGGGRGGGRQGGHGQVAVHHLHGVLCGGAVGGRVVKAWPRPSWQALLSMGVVVSVVMVAMVMVAMVMGVGGAVSTGQGVEGLGLLGRHVEGGLLDGVGLHRHLLGPVTAVPARGGEERLPGLLPEPHSHHTHSPDLDTLNLTASDYKQSSNDNTSIKNKLHAVFTPKHFLRGQITCVNLRMCQC